MKLLDSFSIDGAISIAKTDFLKGQKNGELMMIDKLRKEFIISSRGKEWLLKRKLTEE